MYWLPHAEEMLAMPGHRSHVTGPHLPVVPATVSRTPVTPNGLRGSGQLKSLLLTSVAEAADAERVGDKYSEVGSIDGRGERLNLRRIKKGGENNEVD
ncbi:unnamed protein product [Protopolystoma xenopodis]|uniref:Uncharacterized protein n=1 Tax=Protopolystoma xenopodis TaxID=117903 RepID=A0A448XQ96_9PLAT|nr:unnamed protein product [Protopolystoma xenopodis]